MKRNLSDALVEAKIKLIGSMFPEKIEFDGTEYRTNKYNKVLDLIFQETNELPGVVKRKEDSLCENPQFSTPNRAVLEPILADLDRLWEMRHWIPDPRKPVIRPKINTKPHFAVYQD